MDEENQAEELHNEQKTSFSEARELCSESPQSENSLLDVESSLLQNSYDVTFTITITMAVTAEPDDQSNLKDLLSKQMIDAPKAQNYYHIEYNLLPDDELMKTDVVTYGVACKVYTEKHEAKVVKTWQTGDITWFAWAHSQTVTVTKELLLKMFNHTVELRLWNTKDKCSSRARFDRPKAFRLPQPKQGEKPEDIGGVRSMVTKILDDYMNMQPKKGTLIRPLLSQECPVPVRLKAKEESVYSLADQAASNKLQATKKESKSARNVDAGAKKPKIEKTKADGREEKEVKRQLSEHSKMVLEKIKKFGLCVIPLRLATLFGDKTTAISRLDSPASGIEDVFLDVSIDCPLLSGVLQEDLNPMTIEICSVTNLPASPMSYEELRQKCHPVHCKYSFIKELTHLTPDKEHGRNIYWNDSNIVLIGAMDSSHLKEFINGPGMEIEVHDRDRKPELIKLKPTLFGDDLEDEKISHVGTVESRRTLYNPFHGKDKPWDPYGVARVDLSDLLLGCRFLELKIPVLNCPIPDILGTVPNPSGKLIGIAGAVDGPVDQPLSVGHYVQNSTMLKVRIQLAHPLTVVSKLICKNYIAPSIECPFNRIIFMFDYNNLELLHNLQTLIMSFNSKALGLDTMPQHVIDSALSTYKLSIVQQCSLDLDIVTGFHVLDGTKHIFVLEGLSNKAISILWETLPPPKESGVCVLYNSDLSFSKRLYGPLDVDLCRVKLHEPLSVIVQQPLLYIRDMVFRSCYDALIKLDQITKMNKMTSVIRNDLFPTAEMVVSLSREFGLPFTQKDLQELKSPLNEEMFHLDEPTEEPLSQPEINYKSYIPLDNYNPAYEEYLNKSKEPRNYIKINIKDVYEKSYEVMTVKENNRAKYIAVEADPIYNYSSQHLNSTELALDYLRQYLREHDLRAMYAYNQEFMSGLFCTVNIDKEKKKQAADSRARWRTEKGWTSTEKRSVMQCHAHPKYPDSARIEELREEWQENTLHTNIIKCPVKRENYPWCDRDRDFNLYTRPAPDFGNGLPSTYCVTCSPTEEEKRAMKLKEDNYWQSSVVTDLRQYFHRILPATEMKVRGIHSSNQLDRLKGLLKDPVKKHGLGLGSNVNEIPALSAINDQYLDTSVKFHGSPQLKDQPQGSHVDFCGLHPGDFSHSWNFNDNHVPCQNYEHDRFKQLKGQDFSVYHKSRNKLSLKPILPLRSEERENNLFQMSQSANPYRPLPPVTPVFQHQIVDNQTTDGTISGPGKTANKTEEMMQLMSENEDVSSTIHPAQLSSSQLHIPVMT